MATVPFSANRNGQPSAPMAMPSEENLLMAAAIMHQQGKFQPQGDQVAANVLPITPTMRQGWQKRIDKAESDEDILSIRKDMRKSGVDPNIYPALQPGAGSDWGRK